MCAFVCLHVQICEQAWTHMCTSSSMAQFEPFVCTDAERPSERLPQERQEIERLTRVSATHAVYLLVCRICRHTHSHIHVLRSLWGLWQANHHNSPPDPIPAPEPNLNPTLNLKTKSGPQTVLESCEDKSKYAQLTKCPYFASRRIILVLSL